MGRSTAAASPPPPGEQATAVPRETAAAMLFEAFHRSAMGLGLLRLDRRIELVNEAFGALLRCRPAELAGQPLAALLQPADAAGVAAALQKLRHEAGSELVQVRLMRPDGSNFSAVLAFSAIRAEDGETLGFLTHAMHAERLTKFHNLPDGQDARLMAEAMFSQATEGAAIGQALVGLDGSFLHVNPALCRITGYPADELTRLTFQAITHPEDLDADLSYVADLSAGRIPFYSMDKRYIHKDGSVVWVWLHGSVIRAGDGQPLFYIAQVTEIQGQKTAEAALARREAEFRLLAENAADVVVRVDPSLRILWVSDSVQQALGWTPEQYMELSDDFLIHPDDYESVMAVGADWQSRTGKIIALHEFRVLHADGHWVWVSTRWRQLEDGGGIAALRVVDAEVAARAALRDSERRYRLIADNAGDMVLQAREGVWTWTSPSVTTVLGWPADSLLGQPVLELVHRGDRDAIQAAMRAADSGRDETVRLRLRSRACEWLWTDCHAGPLLDDEGGMAGTLILARDIGDQVRAEAAANAAMADLAHRSSHDALTGLPNRAATLKALDEALAQDDAAAAVLLIDLDRFKEINDGISHAAGDEVLQQVARRLRAIVRPDDLVGRIGGDEFAAVLTHISSAEDAVRTAARLCRRIEELTYDADGHPVTMTITIGIALRRPGASSATLLSDADAALYEAKRAGRNRWQLADEDLRRRAALTVELAVRMRRGVAADEFHAWYQPVVDLATGRLRGYEALARWVTPRVAVPAAEFVGAAEETGLIREIGAVVIEEAIQHLGTLPADQSMAVNVSPTQLTSPDFVPMVLAALGRAGVAPERLIVEITEHLLAHVAPASREAMLALHDAGIRLYIDHFGTGESSLTTLRDFPIDGITLDRSFTAGIRKEYPDPFARGIAKGLGELAGHLGLVCVAEGIETAWQEQELARIGWHAGQGERYGPAEPPAGYPARERLPEERQPRRRTD